MRLLEMILLLCGLTAMAEVKTFAVAKGKIHAVEDASSRFPASLFRSIEPGERVPRTTWYPGSVNVFLLEFEGSTKRVMIDAGFGEPKGALLKEMKLAGIAPESISDILVTHIHPDHVGGLPAFPAARVHIAKKEYDAWRGDGSRKNLARFLPPPERLVLFEYDTEVVPGVTALEYAGHTPGHTVFRLGESVFFIGDLVHAAELQIARPNFCARYDKDPKKAVESRRNALRFLRGEWFGAHIPFPGRHVNP